MNRILIVGHSASGYQTVESVLQQRGMCSPQPSRREELLPQDITATLCKVHKTPHIEHVTVEDDIEQLQVAPVWHGMAMDLMLGNLEQELWGWADPQAIYTLDYWAQLDDQLTFVLVYEEPQSALVNATTKLDSLSAPDLDHLLGNWMAYNGALLHFFLRHTDRCLLVNAQQVRHNTDGCLQKLQPLLSAPLLSLTGDEATDGVTIDGTQLSAYSIHTMMPAQKLTDVISLAGLEATKAQEILQGSVMESYLLNQVLAEYPACQELYAELQSAASLPLQEPHQASNNAAQAWGALVQQRTLAIELASGLHEAYQGLSLNLEQTVAEQARENELRLSQLHQVQEELESYYLRKQELEQCSAEQSREIQHQAELVKQKEAEKSALNKALTETQQLLQVTKSAGQQKLGEQDAQLQMLREESELLLSHLHQVQEELENHYLQKQELELRNTEHSREFKRQAELAKQKEAEKAALNKALTEAQKQLELRNTEHSREIKRQAELIKQKEAEKSALNKALTETQQLLQVTKSAGQQKLGEQDAQLQMLREESELLLSHLHQVQEELENHYLQKQELELRNTEHSREFKRQAELAKQKEAEKAALNKALTEAQKQLELRNTEHSREIKRQAELIKQKEAEKSALNKALTEAQKKLETTQSAGLQKLGEQDVQLKTLGNENDLLLSQLYRVQEELERSYLDNQHLKKQLPVPMYGAADRVQQELGYRLGSVMIKRSRSLTGWLGMPWALRAETRAFRLQCKDHTVLDLPPIHTYCDAHEAERIKNHLSHRLGQTLIQNSKSPLGWVKLPFALGQDVRQFRLQRRGA